MKIRKLLAMILFVAVFVCLIPFSEVKAGEGEWTVWGNNRYTLNGTDIEVKIDGETMHISGTGALPGYDEWRYDLRPWRNRQVVSVNISATIKSIGSNFFAKMDSIKYVTMGTGTYIESVNSFSGIGYKPVFRIFDAGVTTEMIGTIPYTSLDSIVAYAQGNGKGAAFILDDHKKAQEFQNKTNPTIRNVYHAKDSDAPWKDVDQYANGNVATRLVSMSEATRDYSYMVSGQRKIPGKACLEAFAAYIGEYHYACSVYVNVEKEGEKVEITSVPYKYVTQTSHINFSYAP